MYVDMLKGVLDVILDDEYVSVVKQNQSKLDCNKVSHIRLVWVLTEKTMAPYVLSMTS